jgi:hypothetical protein
MRMTYILVYGPLTGSAIRRGLTEKGHIRETCRVCLVTDFTFYYVDYLFLKQQLYPLMIYTLDFSYGNQNIVLNNAY